MKSSLFYAFIILFLSFFFSNCKQASSNAHRSTLLSFTQDSSSAFKLAADIKSHSAIKLAPGLQINIWATDSLAPDPVGMDIDAFNNVYLTRTNRQKNSEFDIRGYPQWMTRSIGFQSVEDRRDFLRKEFATEKSKENAWLPDLNGDSLHDWHDLAEEKEEVWKIEDRNHDGIADISTRVVLLYASFQWRRLGVKGLSFTRSDDNADDGSAYAPIWPSMLSCTRAIRTRMPSQISAPWLASTKRFDGTALRTPADAFTSTLKVPNACERSPGSCSKMGMGL